MSILFTFPGQGSQRAGMLHALPAGIHVRDTLAEASDTLGRDLRTIDDTKSLRSTVHAQLALLIAGVAMARYLVHEAGPADAVAGLSVGAYPAAVVAGVLPFADAVRLLDQRAHLMQAAWPAGHGMTAISGLDRAVLSVLIEEIHTPEFPVYLANFNGPRQLVIAGEESAMARVAARAQQQGAHTVKPMTISVPSHCPLLDEAADELARSFATARISAPRLRYFGASRGRVLYRPAEIVVELARNMALPVKWHDTTVLAHEHGVRLSIEMPPGNVLTRLSVAAFPQALSVAAADTRADSLSLLMAREQRRERGPDPGLA